METQITVKDVDETTFHELKAYAVKHKLTVGRTLSLAIHSWLRQEKKPKLKLSDIKPFKGGKGSERYSEQVDEVLYS